MSDGLVYYFDGMYLFVRGVPASLPSLQLKQVLAGSNFVAHFSAVSHFSSAPASSSSSSASSSSSSSKKRSHAPRGDETEMMVDERNRTEPSTAAADDHHHERAGRAAGAAAPAEKEVVEWHSDTDPNEIRMRFVLQDDNEMKAVKWFMQFLFGRRHCHCYSLFAFLSFSTVAFSCEFPCLFFFFFGLFPSISFLFFS